MVVYRIYSFVIEHKHHWKLRLSWGKKKKLKMHQQGDRSKTRTGSKKIFKSTSKATLKASHLWTYRIYNPKHNEKQLTMSVAVSFETCHKNLTYVLYIIHPSLNKHYCFGWLE